MSPSRNTPDYNLFEGSRRDRQTNRNLDGELENNGGGGGGLVGAIATRIVYGESVIVVMESGDAKDLLLCVAEAGQLHYGGSQDEAPSSSA
jgi:hypothetical protein